MLKTELGRLRKANRHLRKTIDFKLEDHELLKQMFNYLEHKRLNPYDFETVRADILGMAQEAKKRKQPLRELIGDDRAFCDGLLTNCNKSSWSVYLCELLSILFVLLFAVCLSSLTNLFSGSGFIITINARELFIGVLAWLLYYMLWRRIIPLPYTVFKNSEMLFFLIAASWIALYAATSRIVFLDEVLFTTSGYVLLVFAPFFGLGYLILRYAADTLAYKQSSFGGKKI